MRYRVALITSDKKTHGRNFNTREECDEYILGMGDVRKGWIKDFEEDKREWFDFTKED